jgi:biopolymer transport protein ExbD
MAFSTGHGQATAQINITPLIDVLLVLLIIFMVISPVLSRLRCRDPAAGPWGKFTAARDRHHC